MSGNFVGNIADHTSTLKIRSRRNALAAVIQVVVSGISMFILYRILLSSIGVESVGLWSLLMATTSVARITELGLSYSVVKFVAKYLALGEQKTAADIIQTTLITISIFFGVVSLIIYLPLLSLLPNFVPKGAIEEATALLPLAVLSLWVSAIGAVCQAGLDGCQRADLRAYSSVGGSVLTLITASWLVPSQGIFGLAFSQISIAALLLISNWAMLKWQLSALPILPVAWNRRLFKESISYGAGVQMISIIAMFTDVLTKTLLGKFGGLSMLGYYELSSRMMGTLRSLLVSPLQVIVPVIANFQEKNPEQISLVYRKVVALQGYLAIPFYSAFGALIPAISVMWIGYYEPVFVIFSVVQIVGWFFNGFVNPGYFINFGIGRLKWNVVSQIIIGLSNLIFGLILGNYYGGYGVISAWFIAIIIGSAIIALSFHDENKIPISALLPKGGGIVDRVLLRGIDFGLAGI